MGFHREQGAAGQWCQVVPGWRSWSLGELGWWAMVMISGFAQTCQWTPLSISAVLDWTGLLCPLHSRQWLLPPHWVACSVVWPVFSACPPRLSCPLCLGLATQGVSCSAWEGIRVTPKGPLRTPLMCGQEQGGQVAT